MCQRARGNIQSSIPSPHVRWWMVGLTHVGVEEISGIHTLYWNKQTKTHTHILNGLKHENVQCESKQVFMLIRTVICGVPFSSVGRAGVHVQRLCPRCRPWVRLPAWGPLLRMTPPFSHPVSCHLFSYSVNKAIKATKKEEEVTCVDYSASLTTSAPH